MVLACDLVVASRTASFGLPEVKRGLFPLYGGVFRSAQHFLSTWQGSSSSPATRSERTARTCGDS